MLFLMKLGQYYVYCRGKRIAERIYDKKYLKNRYFYKKDKKYLAAGWIWTMNDYKARKSRTMNAGVAFPVSPYNTVWGYENIFFDPSDLLLFQGSGKYFQASNGGRIYIGKGTYIANNTAIITSNHDVHDPDLHTEGKDVVIGKKCWIAFNAVLLPGVVLGDHTTVGAGAVVTRSFPEGNCVIAGNPARLIRKIDPSADNQSIR
ncbi:MAG TPA: acyltransferase [Mobilitalea sp.]|nr:acyltransferase [Mobilitalea sp.]